MEGKAFVDYWLCLRRVTYEGDICLGYSSVCEEAQLKMVILMGTRDEELVQHIVSLDASCSLQDIVATYRSYDCQYCAA